MFPLVFKWYVSFKWPQIPKFERVLLVEAVWYLTKWIFSFLVVYKHAYLLLPFFFFYRNICYLFVNKILNFSCGRVWCVNVYMVKTTVRCNTSVYTPTYQYTLDYSLFKVIIFLRGRRITYRNTRMCASKDFDQPNTWKHTGTCFILP